MCFNGSDQLRGVDVEESSSQVPTMETVHTIITAMVQKAACIVQVNVFNAFLHAKVDVDVYMHHPPGFPGPPGTVCKIKKSQAVVKWIPSEFNLANLLTKSSRNLALFNCLRDHIM